MNSIAVYMHKKQVYMIFVYLTIVYCINAAPFVLVDNITRARYSLMLYSYSLNTFGDTASSLS